MRTLPLERKQFQISSKSPRRKTCRSRNLSKRVTRRISSAQLPESVTLRDEVEKLLVPRLLNRVTAIHPQILRGKNWRTREWEGGGGGGQWKIVVIRAGLLSAYRAAIMRLLRERRWNLSATVGEKLVARARRWGSDGDLLFFVCFSSHLLSPLCVFFSRYANRRTWLPREKQVDIYMERERERVSRKIRRGELAASLRGSRRTGRTKRKLEAEPASRRWARPREAPCGCGSLARGELPARQLLSMPQRRANETSRAPRFRLKLPADSRHAERSKRCGTSRGNAVASS